MNIIMIGMTLVCLLGMVAKKASNNDKPFWEQYTLYGEKAIEWLRKDLGEIIIQKIWVGKLAYFVNHYDCENLMKHEKGPQKTLEDEVVMIRASNIDKVVCVHQKGAVKMVMAKIVKVEAEKGNIATHGLCEIHLDAHGKTTVRTAEFENEVGVIFNLKKLGKNSSKYEIEYIED